MSEYKAVKITGGAVADFQGGKKTRKRKVKGGDEPVEQVEEHSFRNANITKITGGATAIAPVTLPVAAPSMLNSPHTNSIQTPLLQQPQPQPQQQPQPQSQSQSQPQQQGGVKHIRVELKKKQSKKVNLHPKREISKINGNVKKTRKFVLGVSSFHKRMNRAKKMQRTVKAMPIDKLREHLINAKLIKKTSKAPESILRQIAEDSQLVGKHIL
jgi:hypothetical protein